MKNHNFNNDDFYGTDFTLCGKGLKNANKFTKKRWKEGK